MTTPLGSLATGGHARRLPLFLAVGTVGLGATNLVLALLHGRLALILPLAAALSWEAGILVTFVLNDALTWRTHRDRSPLTRLLGYQLVGLVGAAIYAVLVVAATSLAGLHYIPASLLGSGITASWNYAANHGIVFRSRRVQARPQLLPAPSDGGLWT